MKKLLKITVYGKVQGVSYRVSTKVIADQLDVKGFVKNLPNKTVYIEAEASLLILDQFLEWCHEGPERGEVAKVEHQESEVQEYTTFEIRK